MSILSVPWDVRALWATLPFVSRLYLLFLIVIPAYTIFSLAKAMIRLRPFERQGPDLRSEPLQNDYRGRPRNLRQLHFFALLLFGVSLCNDFFGTIRAIQLSQASLSAARIDIFEPALAFAFTVLVALTFLHALQWFISSRLERMSGERAQHMGPRKTV